MHWARRLASRLGRDGNSLRRRTDKIAAWGTAGLLVVFLVAAPILAVSVGHWAFRRSISELQHQRSWREVTAVLVHKAPVEPGSYDASDSWTLARWTPPGGHVREGVISLPAGTPAGAHVRIWLDRSGWLAGPRVTGQIVLMRVAIGVLATMIMLAAVLAGVASCCQWLLDRRRLVAWEAEWDQFGPRWTREFRARG